MEKRVYPDGEMKPEILYEEFLRIQNNSNPYSNNIWTQVGPVNVPIQGNGDKRGIGRVNTISFHPTDPDKIYWAWLVVFGNLRMVDKLGVHQQIF